MKPKPANDFEFAMCEVDSIEFTRLTQDTPEAVGVPVLFCGERVWPAPAFGWVVRENAGFRFAVHPHVP